MIFLQFHCLSILLCVGSTSHILIYFLLLRKYLFLSSIPNAYFHFCRVWNWQMKLWNSSEEFSSHMMLTVYVKCDSITLFKFWSLCISFRLFISFEFNMLLLGQYMPHHLSFLLLDWLFEKFLCIINVTVNVVWKFSFVPFRIIFHVGCRRGLLQNDG